MRIYLDHNASSPVRDEVVEAMGRALRDRFGNPSSVHAEGAAARAAVERARERAAALIGCEPAEIVFTSGASESNHAALHGVLAAAGRGARLVTTTVEHPSVEEPAAALEAAGHPVARLPVERDGRLAAGALAAALAEPAALVSVLYAHNETGVVQDAAALAAACSARSVPLHLDATQALGRIPVDARALGAALLSASVHKLGGPKGVGLLRVARDVALAPWLRGGPQERGRRGGTENVIGIVGLGAACALAASEMEANARAWARLRDRLWEGVREKVPRVQRIGSATHVLPNTLALLVEGAPGEALVQALDVEGVAVSSGAACSSGSLTPSRALLAMGLAAHEARCALRLSLGHGIGEREIERALAVLPDAVARVREAEA